jgi:hypothetical protein
LPNTFGYHEIKFDTWILHGNLSQETLGFFLSKQSYLCDYIDTRPMMNTSDPVSSNLENRKNLITKPGPTIHVNVEVLLKNYTFHSLSGVPTKEVVQMKIK